MYQASGDRHRYYLRGIGNEADFSGLDANFRQAYGYGFSDILGDAWADLLSDRRDGDNCVDIVGFSRGGIEATEFANRVADAFPDERIRFVGLYDPVGSVGQPGWFGGYRFTLPANVEHAAEAMALDEDRSMFPATNVRGAVQQWFRGTHSDVGGGWADHRLSDVALQWMAQQASSAGVSFDLGSVRPEITNPPQPNAPINKNSGFTSWFTTPGGRTVIRPLTVDDVNGYIEATAFGSAYFGL